jgi:hypothetical protein
MPSQGKENMSPGQKWMAIRLGGKIWIRIVNYVEEIIQTKRVHS